jgi:hypothetical protein
MASVILLSRAESIPTDSGVLISSAAADARVADSSMLADVVFAAGLQAVIAAKPSAIRLLRSQLLLAVDARVIFINLS